ncbi:MAG: rane protein [Acidobacteria bacterium]|nr:rane protein [Acidobacteriota bacterium]
MPISPPKLSRASALAGTVIWELGFFSHSSTLIETELINKVLLLAVLVIVPLGLSLAATDQEEENSLLFRLAIFAQPIGAAAVVVSFFLKQGIAAALFSSAWLVVAGLLSLHGLSRLLSPKLRVFEEVSISAGLIYLSVGSGWLIMSRLGIQPLGFGDTIVLLTAVHFHYAGFAAPILSGLAGRVLVHQSVSVQRLFALVVLGVIAGTPLVAAGITLSPSLGLAGTVIISCALLLLGILVIGWIVPGITRRSVQLLLVLSSISPFISMTLASIYAYSIVAKKLIIDIPQMALTHGLINALGFSLCGLLAWTIFRAE